MSEMDSLYQQVYHSANTVQIRSREGLPGGKFGGVLTFVLDVAKDEMILPESLYLSARYNIRGSVSNGTDPKVFVNSQPLCRYNPVGSNTAADQRIPTIGAIASGGIHNMFNKATHEIGSLSGSSVVQHIENYAQSVALLQNAFGVPSKNSTDLFYINDPNDTISRDVDPSTYTIRKAERSISEGYLEYIVKNGIRQGLDRNSEVSLSCRLPFAFFLEEKKVYQSQHILRFTVDTNWQQRMLNVVNVTRPNGGNFSTDQFVPFSGTYVTTEPTAADQVRVELLDIYLHCEYVKISERPTGKQLLIFENFSSTQHPCQSSKENFILPCKPNLLKLIMGIQRNSIIAQNDTKQPALIKSPSAFGVNQTALRNIQVRYLSDVYPQIPYDMLLQNSSIVSGTDYNVSNIFASSLNDTYDAVRAYEDYKNSCEFDDDSKCMTFQQWLSNPVFVFKFCSTANIASSVEITLDSYSGIHAGYVLASGNEGNIRLTPLTDSTLFMLYVYRTILEVDYQGDSVNFKVINVV
ncbi:MAG: hypothetical protein ACRCXZ_10330 [Patescibacteria group bacterium]